MIMKIKEQYKVREMAGEHVIIMQGKHGSKPGFIDRLALTGRQESDSPG